MKAITKYVANDGSEHATPDSALLRELMAEKVSHVMSYLGEVPKDVEDGKGWLQHDPDTVIKCRDAILDLCCASGMNIHYPAFNSRGSEIHPLSIIGRVLSEDGGPLGKAWNRFCRIDGMGREHQQQYYAYTAGPSPEHYCVEDRRKGTQ